METDKEAKSLGATDAEIWLMKIERQLEKERDWRREALDAEKRYEAEEDEDFNILHSNVQTLLPAVFNSVPAPDVRRRFDDGDMNAKHVVDVTERLIAFTLDQYDVIEEIKQTILQALVTDRGYHRIVYDPIIGAGEYGLEQITEQRSYSEAVNWDRVILGPATSWAKMPWIAITHYLDQDELKALSPKHGPQVGLDCSESTDRTEDREETGSLFRTAKVFEIWNKDTKEVLWVAENYKEFPLMVEDDPLGLSNFFPILKPLQHVKRLRSMLPVVPSKVYDSLIDELNEITRRISKLIKQLRVRGLVDGQLQADLDRLRTSEDGEYSAAQSVTVFASSGGLEKAVAHWPMEPTVIALRQLYEQREAVKQTIYEVTGLSDIVRGASDARETLGAQQIKTQWGSLRVQSMQQQVIQLARELFRAYVDIFTGHYQDDVISRTVHMPSTEEQQQAWPQIMQMFRSEMLSYTIDVETDSTVQQDVVRSQEQMNQFLAATGQFAAAISGVVQIEGLGQQIIPAGVEIYTAFARKFKLGKQAEDALERLSTMAQEMAEQGPQEDEDQGIQEQRQHEMQIKQMEIEGRLQEKQIDAQANSVADQQRAQLDQQKAQVEAQKATIDLQIKEIELQIKELELRTKALEPLERENEPEDSEVYDG